MMRKKRIINNYIIILLICVVTGCSGTLFGYDNLDSLYKNNIRNMDISVYYNTTDGYITSTVKNVSSTFMTNLNMSMECEYNNGNIIDYDKCKSLVLKYIYYPQEDGGFIYTDRFGSYPIPVSNDIPVDGVLVIK